MIRPTESIQAGWIEDISIISPDYGTSLDMGMRITSLDTEGPGSRLDYSAGSSPGGCDGQREYRDGVDSRIDGVAKWRMDGSMQYLDHADK
jgi:hypothetical protein